MCMCVYVCVGGCLISCTHPPHQITLINAMPPAGPTCVCMFVGWCVVQGAAWRGGDDDYSDADAMAEEDGAEG